MKVFITGATGYVGHNLAREVASQGHTVHILVRDLNSATIPVHPSIRVFRGDITNKTSLIPAIQGCRQVYHTAALVKHVANKRSMFYDINVEGTRNVLNAAVESGVEKLVFTSTCGVIGPSVKEPMTESDPRITGFASDYDLSKFLAEKLVIEYATNGLHTVITSPAKVFGPGIDNHPISVNTVIKRFISGIPTFCPHPTGYVSNYVFIDDLVWGHMLAMENGRNGEKYILGGENLSYEEFFRIIRDVAGNGSLLIPSPKFVARLYGHWHVLQSKLTGKEPVFNADGVKHIYCNKSFSSEKAINELGYNITPIAKAVQATIHFLKPGLCVLPAIQ